MEPKNLSAQGACTLLFLFFLLQATCRPSVRRKQIEKELFLKKLVGFLIVMDGIREIDIGSVICNIMMK